MVRPLTMKLGTLMHHDEISLKQKLQVCKQQQTAPGNKKLVNSVCASNLLMVGPLTMKLGTLMYHDKSSLKQKLQVCKQPQAIKTCKWCLCLGPQTMKLGTLMYHDESSSKQDITRL